MGRLPAAAKPVAVASGGPAMRRGGVLTLREDGVLLALEGKTSLEEILRVTQHDDLEDALPAKAARDDAGPPAQGVAA